MPYDAKTGKHYDYTKEGIEKYKRETGKGMPMKESPMKNMAYWKAKNASTPIKQISQLTDPGNKLGPNASIEDRVDAKIEEKVDEVVGSKRSQGLV